MVACVIAYVLGVEGFQGAFAGQYLHALLRMTEYVLAQARELYTALKVAQRVFQRLFALFHACHNGLKLLERGFKLRHIDGIGGIG